MSGIQYSIGEVSRILNISKEMIRYYEKQGALKPSRNKENNYRSYSTMDVFFLMELMRYQSVGLSVKQIISLLENHYMDNYSYYLDQYYHIIKKEIDYKNLLRERIKEMSNRAKTSQMNIGKYWFKEIEQHDLVFLCNSIDDEYDRISINNSNLFTDDYFAFYESIVLFEEKYNTWWYGINQYYKRALLLESKEKKLESSLCLCTMIDMGEIGKFNRHLLNPIYNYINEHGYIINGITRGMIVCRGYENNIFQRILEIQVPIKR